MKEVYFILLVIIFILAFIKIEIYFIYKSREKFEELKKAYIDLKNIREDLHNLLKDKDL
jgi:flagellar biogenesis protein FliO